MRKRILPWLLSLTLVLSGSTAMAEISQGTENETYVNETYEAQEQDSFAEDETEDEAEEAADEFDETNQFEESDSQNSDEESEEISDTEDSEAEQDAEDLEASEEEDFFGEDEKKSGPQNIQSHIFVNPLYEDIFTEADIRERLSETSEGTITAEKLMTDIDNIYIYDSLDDVEYDMREQLVNRDEMISIGYFTDEDTETIENWSADDWQGICDYILYDLGFMHTGTPYEGDYLRWQLYGGEVDSWYEWNEEEERYALYFTYQPLYYTTLEQEEAVTEELDYLIPELLESEETDYDKIRMIYEYVCDNVTYDYDNVDNADYLLQYTAYGALIDETAVCQGYAVLMYRMLLTAGIDCRVITSAEHAWNIVELNGYYFNIDATWDAGKYYYDYENFLKQPESFEYSEHHIREEWCSDPDFTQWYPMADFDWHATPLVDDIYNTSSGVKIKWYDEDADQYRVYRKSGNGGWKRIGDTYATEFTDTTAKSGTVYTYTVRCISYYGDNASEYNRTGDSIRFLSNGVISKIANISKGIQVTWKKVAGAQGYIVYRADGSGKYKAIATIKNGNTVTYSDTKATANGTKYTYAVRAYNGSTKGAYTGKTYYRLATHTIKSVKNTSVKAMTVIWNKNTKATGYQVWYKTGSTAKTVTIKSNATLKTVLKSLKKGASYSVRVRSYKTISGVNYYSAWSAAKTVKITK